MPDPVPDCNLRLTADEGYFIMTCRSIIKALTRIMLVAVVVHPALVLSAKTRGDDEPERTVQRILARADAVFSGKMDYHLKCGLTHTGEVVHDSEERFTFSGNSWAWRFVGIGEHVCHRGIFVDHTSCPQPSGNTDHSVAISNARAVDQHRPCPPFFGGTFWYKSTGEFVRANADKARIIKEDSISGVRTVVVEWSVAPKDLGQVFRSFVSVPRARAPAILRVHAAPDFGYALVRIEHISSYNGGEVDAVMESDQFKKVAPGVYFPMQCRFQAFGERGQPLNYIEYMIRNVKNINEPIDEEEFYVSVPEGASVHDRRDSKNIITFRFGDGAGFTKDLEGLIGPEKPAWFRRTWFLAICSGTALGLIFILCYVMLRDRVRRSA